MAKILYGVSGEGFGHAARSKEIISHLISQGHQVKVLSYDRGFFWLKKFFDTEEIFGLRLTYENNSVKYLPTIFDNAMNTPQVLKSVTKIRQIMKDFKPELVITDFEPLSATTANLHGIPLISIDNQHLLTRTEVDYPSEFKKDFLAAKVVTRLMVMHAKIYLITNFFTVPIVESKTRVLPPIVRQEVLSAEATEGDYHLVYLTSNAEAVPTKLKGLKEKFIVYGVVDKVGQDENLLYKPLDQATFLADLAGAKSIVANAGLSLISEALYLGKPYLAVPAKNQFEQLLNAYYLDKLGYGQLSHDLTKTDVETFLAKLSTYKNNLKHYPKSDNSLFFEAIDEAIADCL